MGSMDTLGLFLSPLTSRTADNQVILQWRHSGDPC